jgi:thioredoxin reductase (NADPH)
VLVVGGGNSAVEESLFLTKFASKVSIAARGAQLSASRVAQEKAFESPKLEVLYETVVAELRGDTRLRSVLLRDVRTGETREARPAAVFVFVGLQPNTGFLRSSVDLDERGFIKTDLTLQTSLEGVFAAGDARLGATKQLVAAAGEGATAALMIRQYLEQAKVVPVHKFADVP